MSLNAPVRSGFEGSEVIDMGKFNIYTRTSASHTLPQNITGMYIIEHIHDGKTDTYPPPTRSTLEHQDKASPWVMTAVLITRAVNVILCMKPQNIESITVYMDEISRKGRHGLDDE